MAIEEGLFWAKDGERLFYRLQQGNPSRHPFILVHGHGEHSGRYVKFFENLRNFDGTIAAFDLRGCGRSSGEAVYVSNFQDFLADLTSFIEFLNLRFQIKAPIQLFGHSLGGLIAVAWARENEARISKLILSSPLMGLPSEALVRCFGRLLNPICPHWVLKNPVKANLLTHDPDEIAKYRRDPLIRRKITVRLSFEMLRYLSFLRESKITFSFPVYILMAERDFIVAPQATHKFFAMLESPDKQLESFADFYHEIFNETGQNKAFERLRYYLLK